MRAIEHTREMSCPTMSDNDEKPPEFRNQDTLHRRAWIDRALAGVRHRLEAEDPASLQGGHGSSNDAPVALEVAGKARRAGPLYLVRGEKRR